MKVVSSEVMARIDLRSQAEFAMPSLLLMENAGAKAWAVFSRFARGLARPSGRRPAPRPGSGLVFVAGKGNNGGDALVMARQAHVEGARGLTVILAAGRPEMDTDPGRNLAMCESLGIECLDWTAQARDSAARLAAASWIFDGISGTGLRGTLHPPLSELVEGINACRARTVAVDVPSGVGDAFRAGQPAVRAEMTLTMGLPKLCLYLPAARAFCGRIIVVPVGFPPSLLDDPAIPGEILEENAWRLLVPPIAPDTHKNRRGHLAVFAGSPGTTGAAWLAASAAARARVGLVTLFADRDVYPILAQKSASVMVRPWEWPASEEAFEEARFSGMLAGPGWGISDDKERWLERLISSGKPGVLDADGIALLARIAARRKLPLAGRWVLTPHPGEFALLAGVPREEVLADPVAHALAASAGFGAVVVLKGACTCIAAPSGKYWILDGVNPALATGGSGDVLAGLIGAGIAGGMEPLDAALFGVSLHSRAGRAARRRCGWFLAEDLVPLVSRILR